MQKSIAFLKSQLSKRGGLEKYTLRLAEACAKAGHKCTLLTNDYPENHTDLPFEIVTLGAKAKLSIMQLLLYDFRCKKYLQQHPVDVVFGLERNFCPQTHYRAGNGCHAAYLERRSRTDSWLKRQSFSINPLHQIILQMEKRTFESEHLIRLIANSNMVKEEIRRFYPKVDPGKIKVIHNGVEWSELALCFEEGLILREKILKQLDLHPDRYQFLFVGNEYERKGLGLLLEALALLSERHFQLTVIGKERHIETFVQKAANLGLSEHVRFIGESKEVKVFYSAADCLVIPSMYDPFANVTIEALAMGLFVISSAANGGSEVITQPHLGMVFNDLQDPTELAGCLKEAMKRPKETHSATKIRDSVRHLDFANQIGQIVNEVSK